MKLTGAPSWETEQRAVFQKQGKAPGSRAASSHVPVRKGPSPPTSGRRGGPWLGSEPQPGGCEASSWHFLWPEVAFWKHDPLCLPVKAASEALCCLLFPAPGHWLYSKQCWVKGGEEVRVATLAFCTFVSLIFISSVTGGEVRRRRRKCLQTRGWSNSKRKLAFIPGGHLTSGLVSLGK